MTRYFIPQKPYSPIDNANRVFAATGSSMFARGSANADYNGHPISLTFNDYKGCYILATFWAGRNVLSRDTDFARILGKAIAEFDQQGRGAALSVTPLDKDAHIAKSCSRLMIWTEELEETERAKWYCDLHAEAARRALLEKSIPGQRFDDIADSWRIKNLSQNNQISNPPRPLTHARALN